MPHGDAKKNIFYTNPYTAKIKITFLYVLCFVCHAKIMDFTKKTNKDLLFVVTVRKKLKILEKEVIKDR